MYNMKLLVIVPFLLVFNFLLSQRQNLGPVINDSRKTEAYVVFSPDGNTMYFSRKNPNTHFDIYYSTRMSNGSWSTPQPIYELNNEKPNMVFYVYPDGNSMLVNGAYPEKGICKVTKINGRWGNPTMLKFEPRVTQWNQHNAKLSSDGKVMILSYQYDICVSFLQPNGTWSYPQKLPSNINTPYYEYTPFLAPDDRTLFFSSGGHGAASNDIFVTTRLDDTWMNWSNPINCGSVLNSVDWESHFVIPPIGELSYVYSLSEGNGDIFTVPLKDLQLGNPMVTLSGVTLDKNTQKPIQAEIEFIFNQDSYKTTSDAQGNYTIWLPSNRDYLVNLKSEGYQPKNEKVNIISAYQFQKQKKDFYLEKEKTITHQEFETENSEFSVVYFDFDKDSPKETSIEELKRIVDIAKQDDISIKIEGHTDAIGTDEYNMGLSIRRALSVYRFLMQFGIPEIRMQYEGFGETRPVDTNKTEDGRARNRRVEILLKKKISH